MLFYDWIFFSSGACIVMAFVLVSKHVNCCVAFVAFSLDSPHTSSSLSQPVRPSNWVRVRLWKREKGAEDAGRLGGWVAGCWPLYLDRGSGNGCGRANMLFIIICSCCYFSCLLLLLISLFLIAGVLRPSVHSRCCSHSRWCFGVVSVIVVIFIALHHCCSAVFGCFCSCLCRLCVFNKYIILWT